MSKIDEFNKARETYNRVKNNLFNATRRDREGNIEERNDKAVLEIRYYGKHTQDWNDACLILHASHGYYGSSSGYSDMDNSTAKYMVKALNNHLREIADEAIEMAKADMESARKAAENEAKLVLGEITAQ